MTQEREYIKTLAIFHYVVAGIAALCSLFPTLHLVLGIGMVSGGLGGAEGQGEFPGRMFGWFFIIFASLFILCGLTFAVCLAVAGRYLSQFKHHRYCLVIAGIACIFVPFGTVLGVFTIIVLIKESTRELFRHQPSAELT